jgi:hypothetical protein
MLADADLQKERIKHETTRKHSTTERLKSGEGVDNSDDMMAMMSLLDIGFHVPWVAGTSIDGISHLHR